MSRFRIPAIETHCIFQVNKMVACDDYIIEGAKERDFSCCKNCGWNPSVTDKRLAKLKTKLRSELAKKTKINTVWKYSNFVAKEAIIPAEEGEFRSMSEKELAEWLATAIARHHDPEATVQELEKGLWLDWPKKED